MKRIQPQAVDREGAVRRLGSEYRCYRAVEELEGTVKRFYEVVAETAGLSLRDLVKAVYRLEQRLLKWQKRERRRLEEEKEMEREEDEGMVKGEQDLTS